MAETKLGQRELIYLAGVVDARGKMAVYAHGTAVTRGASYAQTRLRVHSSDYDWLAQLKAMTGEGSLSGTRGKDRSTTHTWTVLGAAAKELIRALQPYLKSPDAIVTAKQVSK